MSTRPRRRPKLASHPRPETTARAAPSRSERTDSSEVRCQELIFNDERLTLMRWRLCGPPAPTAGTSMGRGFLVGATGRRTLNGEGLQHEDGHSLLLASTFPSIHPYDISCGFELATIINDGMCRMFTEGENICSRSSSGQSRSPFERWHRRRATRVRCCTLARSGF
jgi:Pyruvate dehydrogenase E1 component middle domain